MNIHTCVCMLCYFKCLYTLGQQQELSERWLGCLVQPLCWVPLAYLGTFPVCLLGQELSIKGLRKWGSWLFTQEILLLLHPTVKKNKYKDLPLKKLLQQPACCSKCFSLLEEGNTDRGDVIRADCSVSTVPTRLSFLPITRRATLLLRSSLALQISEYFAFSLSLRFSCTKI